MNNYRCVPGRRRWGEKKKKKGSNNFPAVFFSFVCDCDIKEMIARRFIEILTEPDSIHRVCCICWSLQKLEGMLVPSRRAGAGERLCRFVNSFPMTHRLHLGSLQHITCTSNELHSPARICTNTLYASPDSAGAIKPAGMQAKSCRIRWEKFSIEA